MLKALAGCSLAMLILVSLPGCASLRRSLAQEPEAKLKELRVESVSLSGVELALEIEVFNPNRYTLKLLELNYQVHAFDTMLGEGTFQDDFEVPGRKSRVLSIPFHVRTRAALNMARHFMAENEAIEAKLQGDLRIGTAVGSWQVTFDETKSIKNPFND